MHNAHVPAPLPKALKTSPCGKTSRNQEVTETFDFASKHSLGIYSRVNVSLKCSLNFWYLYILMSMILPPGNSEAIDSSEIVGNVAYARILI